MISDNPTISNPYTGDPLPFRNNWTDVVSKGPHDKIAVPKDAFIWNPYKQTWKFVDDNNTTALTKIKMIPLFSKWHNGIAMDKYDLLYPFYFQYEWATDTKNNDKTFDAEFSSLALPTLSLIKGIKFNKDNSFETYIDQWHFDKRQLPQFGALWASEPWEITAATERLVSNNKLSYSKSDSNIKQNEQLSLVLPSHAELIKEELEKMKQENFIPNPLKGLISLDYALKRYDASIQWINLHQNAAIGNGPYYLDSFNPTGGVISLKKFIDPTYPYKEGSFSLFENPPKTNIDKIDVPKFIKIGSPLNLDIDLAVGNSSLYTKNPAADIINYIILDRNNNVAVHGNVNSSNNSGVTVSSIDKNNADSNNHLTTKIDRIPLEIGANKTKLLPAGPAKLKMFVTSTDSLRPSIYEYTLIARP
jgi:peptide/nickel transport system substrate-binding protein